MPIQIHSTQMAVLIVLLIVVSATTHYRWQIPFHFTHIYINIYTYIYVCTCVCLCLLDPQQTDGYGGEACVPGGCMAAAWMFDPGGTEVNTDHTAGRQHTNTLASRAAVGPVIWFLRLITFNSCQEEHLCLHLPTICCRALKYNIYSAGTKL